MSNKFTTKKIVNNTWDHKNICMQNIGLNNTSQVPWLMVNVSAGRLSEVLQQRISW